MSHDAIDRESFGILVGWSHHPMGQRVDLRLQCVQSASSLKRDEIDSHHVVMTREQATILANYLFRISEATPPQRKRGLISRLFRD